jgi:hypothetical protein
VKRPQAVARETGLAELAAQWRARAVQLREWSGAAAESVAHAYERAADELCAEIERDSAETVTLTEAERISGYSADHIGRLLRNGTVSNAGRKNAPRVRLSDLPRKPGAALKQPTGNLHIDREARAQAVINRHVGKGA